MNELERLHKTVSEALASARLLVEGGEHFLFPAYRSLVSVEDVIRRRIGALAAMAELIPEPPPMKAAEPEKNPKSRKAADTLGTLA